jgi:hypothetical protein
VVHGESCSLEHAGVLRGRAGRGGDEADTLLDDELGDAGIAHERLGDVHAEGPVGEVAHGPDLALDGVEFTRRRLDDPAGTGGRHR